jgi:hypothetical protein
MQDSVVPNVLIICSPNKEFVKNVETIVLPVEMPPTALNVTQIPSYTMVFVILLAVNGTTPLINLMFVMLVLKDVKYVADLQNVQFVIKVSS